MRSVIKKLAIGILVLFGLLVVFGSYNAYDRYRWEQDSKKRAAEEIWRRDHLTPEQRLAEDRKKSEAAAAAARSEREATASAALGQLLVEGKKICVASWILAVKDPESAKLENYEGAMVADNEYFAQIYGRAKNSFGGYVRSTWNCRAVLDGNQLKVVSLEETRQ